jgi:hypothetical protein
MARYAPYLPPQRPNFDRLKTFLGARASAARGRILALREDLGYFADGIYHWCKQQREVRVDSVGKVHSSDGQTPFWDVVLTDLVDDTWVLLFPEDIVS